MNEGLHVLRGLAAVSVIFYHAAHMPPYSDVGALTVFHEFGAGVTLFFLLSGFSLTLSNIEKVQERGWTKSYTLKRFFRIAPLWWFMVLLTMGYHYLEYGKIYSMGEIIRHIVPIFGLSPGHHESFVWAGWTIGVEVIFYTVFPILLAVLGRSILSWLGFTALAAIISVNFVSGLPEGIPESYKYMAFPRQMVVFCIGVLLFLIVSRIPGSYLMRTRQIALILAAGLFYVWTLQHRSPGQNIMLYPVIFKAVALGVVIIFFYSVRSILANPVTKFWGDASYAIYLLHPIVVHETKFVHAWLSEQLRSVELAFCAYVSVVLIIVCILAKIVHSILEEPLYKYGRTLASLNAGARGHETNSAPNGQGSKS